MQIAPRIFFYPFTSYQENNCNSILIDGPGKVLIDPGHKRFWPQLKKNILADGHNPAEIKTVLFTHAHPDHLEAGPVLAREYGAELALNPLEEEFLRGPGWDFFPAMGLEYPQLTIDRPVEPGLLDLAGQAFEACLTPGHTPGSLCFYRKEDKILITGDLIFAQGVGRTDFPAGDSAALRDSVRRMSELEVEILLPGHGPAVLGADRVRANFQMIFACYF